MAHFLSVDGQIEFSLMETRYSIAMMARCDQRDPPVNWIYVFDSEAKPFSGAAVDKVTLQVRHEIAGFVVFQEEINGFLNFWRRDWIDVLDNIDKVLQVGVEYTQFCYRQCYC